MVQKIIPEKEYMKKSVLAFYEKKLLMAEQGRVQAENKIFTAFEISNSCDAGRKRFYLLRREQNFDFSAAILK